ncbi:sulfite exporter TauE/SafE family protein [Aestuariimicrobium sp. Y1814]|uniref:sulfite exporter TauE/SafE family protein n=1 Tax=Aestuariimicrobium sp. Y1814 TaxID=3418742 RepID=UPI003DA75629
MSPVDIVIAVIAGFAIGFSMGSVGGGGAILAVPVLVYALGQPPLQATTGSLIVVGATGLLGTLLAHRRARLDIGQGLVFGAVAVVGSSIGAIGAHWVAPEVLMASFAVLMLVVAVTTVRRLRRTPKEAAAAREARPVWAAGQVDWPQVGKVVALGTVVGLLTGFLGVGGGFLIVPALTLVLGVPMWRAGGTSLMVITISCAAALLTRLVSAPAGVQPQWTTIGVLAVLAVVGLLVGDGLAAKANNRQLSIGFAVLVCAVAIYTAVQALPALLG